MYHVLTPRMHDTVLDYARFAEINRIVIEPLCVTGEIAFEAWLLTVRCSHNLIKGLK
jgi:hypothetical protein